MILDPSDRRSLVRLVRGSGRDFHDRWPLLGYFLAHRNRAGHILDPCAPGDSLRSGADRPFLRLPDLTYDIRRRCSGERGFGADVGLSRTAWRFYRRLGRIVHAYLRLTSAPFDNWWHDSFGLDVKILSPPHVVLIVGIFVMGLGGLTLITGPMK